ncbi:MAG: hypothetical protein KF835_13425 [Xanthobacteraceae bacterium]|nr:hypothetical protein [Xanthobacteraceae bacterium]
MKIRRQRGYGASRTIPELNAGPLPVYISRTAMTDASTNTQGFLVVLSDVRSEDEHDYLGWLTTEHVQERLGIPGFLGVRVFRRPVADGRRYFIWYRLASADVVDSAAYLQRLNHPTPWSQRIMPILGNFGRGGGTVTDSAGGGTGEFLLALELENPLQAADDMMAATATGGFRAAHLLVTDRDKSAVQTSERALRKSDNSFAVLLLLESDALKTPEDAAAALPPGIMLRADSLFSGSYRAIFSLQN